MPKRVIFDYAAFHEAADRQMASVRSKIVAALDVAYRDISNLDAFYAYTASPETFRRAIAWDKVAAILGADPSTYIVYKAQTAADHLAEAFIDGGRVVASTFGISLDLVNDYAVQYGQARAGTLIVGIQQQQLDVVRQVLQRALTGNVDPERAGRLLRATVGMTPKQAQSLVNYERGLYERMVNGSTNIGLRGAARPLADQRFSVSNLTPQKIEQMVERYRERLINYRGEMIARTETMRAANMGSLAEMRAAGMSGLFDLRTAKRVWIVVPDDRLCELCEMMDGATANMDAMFMFPDDPATLADEQMAGEMPPLHPMCRCTTILEITNESMVNAFAAGEGNSFEPLMTDLDSLVVDTWNRSTP